MSEFAKPVFRGKRFREGALPVPVLSELERYRRVIIEAAKDLWRSENEEERRLPKGFSDAFDLCLTAIERGSAAAQLIVREEALFPELGVFARARDYVANLVKLAEQGERPEDVSQELLRLLGDLGLDLHAEDEIEVGRTREGEVATVTPVVQRRFADWAAEEPQIREFCHLCRVFEINTKTATFQVAPVDGGRILVLRYMLADRGNILRALEEPRDYLLEVAGHGLFLGAAMKKTGTAVSSRLVGGPSWEERLDELARLPAGWLDGAGLPVTSTAIDSMRRVVGTLVPRMQLDKPHLYPTEEGGVKAEWRVAGGALHVTTRPGGKDIDAWLNTGNLDEECTAASAGEVAEWVLHLVKGAVRG